MPLYGAGDVNLITGAETSPNITQSETFTWANPDNPQQVVSAYNDSRGHNQSPINISVARSPPTAALPSPASPPPPVKAPLPVTWAILLFCTIALTPPGSPSGSIRPAAVRAWADTSPPIHRTRLAGPVSVFTTAAVTTGILAGLITTHPLRLRTGCHFLNDFAIGWWGSAVTHSTDNGLLGVLRIPVHWQLRPRRPDHRRQGHGRRIDRRHGRTAATAVWHNRNNKIYRSTDGGNTWTNTYTGPSFVGPCRRSFGLLLHDVPQPRLLAAHGLG